jgi:competence protein ComFC
MTRRDVNRWVERMRQWLEAGLSLIYPEVCQCCERQTANARQGFVCADCRKLVRWIRSPYCERCGLPFEGEITTRFECANCREMELYFSRARSAVAARGLVLDVLHRYKYQRAVWYEPFLVELLVCAAAPELPRACWDGVVPVPLHTVKKNEREFNQAERLARQLARATGIPLRGRVLKRVAPTRTQTRLTREERAANVRNAFMLNDAEGLKGQRIILVDDVFTTGATTSACARVLQEGGAAEVCVWTVARGLLD